MNRQQMNIRAIQARDAAKDFKSRQGGISDEAWKGISSDERKEFAEAGLTQATGIVGWKGERQKAMDSNSNWERAAYEHGFGNVREADDLREVFQASKDIGIKDMDSWNDARQFRRAHNDYDAKTHEGFENRIKDLEKASGGAAPQAEAAVEPAPEEMADPSQEIIDAKMRVGAWEGGKQETGGENMFKEQMASLTGNEVPSFGQEQTAAQAGSTDSNIANTNYTLDLGSFGNQANEGTNFNPSEKGRNSTLNLNQGYAPNSKWV